MTTITLPNDPAALIQSSGPGFDLDDPRVVAELLGHAGENEPSGVAITELRQSILAKAAWAEDRPWPGRSGTTDYHAYRAFLAVAFEANKTIVGMSQYDLAERIGVSNKTAWASIQRLERQGLIAIPDHGVCPECKWGKVVLKRRGGQRWSFYGCDNFPECNYVMERSRTLAFEYRLVEQEGERNYVTHSLHSLVKAKSDVTTLIPDAFRTRQGFPKGALPLLDYLEADRPQKPSELARWMKRHPSTVRHYLRELGEYGVALKVEGGWILGEYDLEALAVTLDTAGATERMRAYNENVRRPNLRRYLEHQSENAQEGLPQARIQAREGAMVSEAGTPDRGVRGTALPRRSAEPVSATDGRHVPVEPMEKLGPHTADLLTDDRPRLSVGGNEMGNGTKGREAACLGCGQVQTFTAPDLRPYSCAYCKGRFEFVDELAMAVA